MRKISLICSFLLSVLIVHQAYAHDFAIDDKKSSIDYYVEHVVGFNAGVFQGFDGTISMSDDYKKIESLDINVSVDSLSSGNEEKDAFVKSAEFFDRDNYPTIRIKSKKFKKDKMIAQVTIKGITKDITFKYRNYSISLSEDNQLWSMVAVHGTIDRKDFGIDHNVQSEQSGRDMLGTEFEITMRLNGIRK